MCVTYIFVKTLIFVKTIDLALSCYGKCLTYNLISTVTLLPVSLTGQSSYTLGFLSLVNKYRYRVWGKIKMY